MNDTSAFPPPPWHLRGQARAQLHWIPFKRAQAMVPAGLKLVPALPGRSLGAVYCASYTADSSLQYRELIVSPGLVRHRHRLGAWISHIFVDDCHSLAGGHAIWSLPKALAEFQDDPDGGITVAQDNEILCRLPGNSREPSRRGIPWPLLVPVISMSGSRVLWFTGRGRAVVTTAPGTIEVPDTSPLAILGLSRGRQMYLSELDLLMHAP